MVIDDATIDRIAQRLLQLLRADRDLARAPTAPRPGLLTAEELAVELRVSRKAIQAQVKEGLPTRKIGSLARYDLEEVKAWLKKRSEPAPIDDDGPPPRLVGQRAR